MCLNLHSKLQPFSAVKGLQTFLMTMELKIELINGSSSKYEHISISCIFMLHSYAQCVDSFIA